MAVSASIQALIAGETVAGSRISNRPSWISSIANHYTWVEKIVSCQQYRSIKKISH